MLCSIHQPNFFPWLGYFNKIVRSDVFVFMDDVDYPKSSKSMGGWTNRVSIIANGSTLWISCPTVREHGSQRIKDVLINDALPWRDKIKKTLLFNYKKAKHYEEGMNIILPLLDLSYERIADYNIAVITSLCDLFEIRTKIIRQSALQTALASTDLLIEITKMVQCDSYLCGGGASDYQEDSLFAQNGIFLIRQKFQHPAYKQTTDLFLAGQSLIDVLLNCGIEETGSLIRSAN